MQPQREDGGDRQEAERVKRVRLMRRAAARRRRILSASLLVASIGVAVLSQVLVFSPLYTAIPLALLILVLVSGARAATQARQWEARLAERQRRRKAKPRPRAQAPAQEVVSTQQPIRGETTDALSQQDIRAAIIQSRQAQVQALEARAQAQARLRPAASAERAKAAAQKAETRGSALSSTDLPKQAAQARTQAKSKTLEPEAKPGESHDHNLLSFSMGSPREGVVPRGPELLSREIKSTKQVSKAVPVKDHEPLRAQAAQPSRAGKPSRPADFHQREVQADVDAPELSEDSLGKVGVEAILARRSKS
ncbi:hypothetical protein AB656_06820 [Bifidobacterium actinocoloniiforme DSM 22766]|nr:hypothetical protein AB656_06820 [Bifidobacterium actinocoloniiforme DSM 22766]